MPLRRSGNAFTGVVIDVTMSPTFGDGCGVFWRVSGVQVNNIRLIGKVRYYRRFLRSEFTEYFVQLEEELRADRGVLQIPFFAAVDDIVRFIPLYDFTNFEIWTSKQ